MSINSDALDRYHNVLRQAMPKVQDPTLDPRIRVNYIKVVTRAQERMAKIIGLDNSERTGT